MKYVDFCGERISEIGVGSSAFPSANEASTILNIAYRYGINYVDTAATYHSGETPYYIGQWMPYINRKKIYIASKVSIYQYVYHPEKFIEMIKSQCNILNTNYIDFFLVHDFEGVSDDIYSSTWESIVKNGDYQSILDALKQSGLVNHIGFSYSGSGKIFDLFLKSYDWEFCMVRNNFLDKYYRKNILNEPDTAYNHAIAYKKINPNFGVIGMECFQKSELIGLDYGEPIPSEIVAYKYASKDNNPLLIGVSSAMQLSNFIERYMIFSDSDIQYNHLINKMIDHYESNISFEDKCMYCYKCSAQCPDNYAICFLKKQFHEAKLKGKYRRLKSYVLLDNIPCNNCSNCVVDCPFGNLKDFVSRVNDFLKPIN